MNRITVPIKLHTTNHNQGTYLCNLCFEYRGNNYHLQGGTGSIVHIFTAGVALYVLAINEEHGYMGLNAYMAPEPDPINCLFLHSSKEIREYLGAKWESLKPEIIVTKLIEYLY